MKVVKRREDFVREIFPEAAVSIKLCENSGSSELSKGFIHLWQWVDLSEDTRSAT